MGLFLKFCIFGLFYDNAQFSCWKHFRTKIGFVFLLLPSEGRQINVMPEEMTAVKRGLK